MLRNQLRVPKSINVYVFGSVLHKHDPNDIDIIVVYDQSIYPNYLAIDLCKDFIIQLQNIIMLEVHITYLSKEEEKNAEFTNEVGAISLETFLSRYFDEQQFFMLQLTTHSRKDFRSKS